MAKNAPASTITSQIPAETFTNYETIENIASNLGISETVISNVLTTNKENLSCFINDNIEIISWLNYQDSTSLEVRLKSVCSNGLSTVNNTYIDNVNHAATSDCFAKTTSWLTSGAIGYSWNTSIRNSWKNLLANYLSTIKSNWETYTNHPFLDKSVFDYLNTLVNNETIIFKTGKYYKIKLGTTIGPINTGENYYVSALLNPFRSICTDWIFYVNNLITNPPSPLTDLNQGKIFISYNELQVSFYLEEVSVGDEIPGITVTMTSTRNAIMNQPYDMFAIPASNTKIVDNGNEYDVYGEYAQKAAIELVKELTSSNVYDVQLLPYCPIPEMAGDGEIDISNFTSGYDYDWLDYTGAYLKQFEGTDSDNVWSLISAGLYRTSVVMLTGATAYSDIDSWDCELNVSGSRYSFNKTYVTDGGYIKLIVQIDQISLSQPTNEVIGHFWWTEKKTGTIHRSIIIYPKSNSFSVALDYNLTLKESMKIDSQTDLYRLVSPNYQGSFDFNVAKNGGAVNGFVADCTYKPYTPYIKVSPNFGWLYGANYGDCRGLICGGDFSIGIINSAWEQYQLQNKNYQNIFNREIQNLDVNQSIQRTQQYVSGGLNIARDTIAGGVGGGLATGSPYGAIAGAVLGGAGSGIGYGIDMNLMEKGLQEQRQFAIDKYKMQLGNIQALPYTLTKVGAFNINSKVFPFLEYYTCSEQEKQALKMKIQYEGMTVGVVDILGNYMSGGYVQADLIRNEAIIEDSHQLDDVYIELTKGVYM